MAEHIITPNRATLHGKWSSALEPAVRVKPGDIVEWRDVLDISWGCGQHDRANKTREKWGPRESPGDDGPALHGPVFVEGAMPGTTLVAELLTIEPGDYGWTMAGDIGFNADLNRGVGLQEEDQLLLLWEIDAETMTAVSEFGTKLPIRPFFGTIGICPAGDEVHEGWFPTAQGGNMDLPELVEGTTIYFPVAHEGALLSLGDSHARQGDGELAGSAIECMTRRGRIRIDVRDDFPVATLTADTPNGWVTAGFDRDLDRAIHQAVSGMLDLMERLLDVDRIHAMALASAVVDVRITQLVNGVRGAHARLHPEVLR